MRDWIFSESNPASGSADNFSGSAARLGRLRSSIESVIRGKSETVTFAIVALLANGHILIEDVPGIGKTTLANTLARSLDLSFQRVQFTSDLLPSDVIGLSIFDQSTGEFEWRPGPIFSNIVLADEINRATPKTQSALLEAMAEEQVTVEGLTRPLPRPFVVVATQNPSEHHGTYPLPESQLDRFMLRLHMGYPTTEDERMMLQDRVSGDPLRAVTPVMTRSDLIEMQESVRNVRMDESLIDYLLQIVALTRNSDQLELGISPRGTIALSRSAQALAFIEGRDYCIADDIKRMVIPCFAHRVIISSRAAAVRSSAREAERVMRTLLEQVSVPV